MEVRSESRPRTPHWDVSVVGGRQRAAAGQRQGVKTVWAWTPRETRSSFFTSKLSAAIHGYNSLARERWQTKHQPAEKH